MRKSARLAEKKANSEDGAHLGTKAKKNRSDDRISKIAALDNGTLVEAFKYLNYCQLATRSLVSKRYRDVIQTYRHSLACLHIREISIAGREMGEDESSPLEVKIFDKELSPEAYNEWVIRNGYSKQVPVEDGKQSTIDRFVYSFDTIAAYDHDDSSISDSALTASTELNNENWPIFQHFIRLLTDPFISIYDVELVPQNDVLNLLSEVLSQDQKCLQCTILSVDVGNDMQKFMSWIKDYVGCNEVKISDIKPSDDKELFDFFMTGAKCTYEVYIIYYDLSEIIINFVEKFMDLKDSDEYQVVESIRGWIEMEALEVLKSEYADFLVKENKDYLDRDTITFEFTNNNNGKKVECVLHYSS
ncbi:hypothetical protein Ddc_14814 [Ditylenchus destructor]|nr:hypothetical protein Ddc_14814 [Ditylenchus destructor]